MKRAKWTAKGPAYICRVVSDDGLHGEEIEVVRSVVDAAKRPAATKRAIEGILRERLSVRPIHAPELSPCARALEGVWMTTSPGGRSRLTRNPRRRVRPRSA